MAMEYFGVIGYNTISVLFARCNCEQFQSRQCTSSTGCHSGMLPSRNAVRMYNQFRFHWLLWAAFPVNDCVTPMGVPVQSVHSGRNNGQGRIS